MDVSPAMSTWAKVTSAVPTPSGIVIATPTFAPVGVFGGTGAWTVQL
jgi:hypothetical protein